MRRSSSSLKAPNWSPPTRIAIYLSTIELPDLKPVRREHNRPASRSSGGRTPDSKGSNSSNHHGIGKLFKTRS